MANPVIQTNNLSKRYSGNSNLALNRLKLSVETGEIYGFIGPNGAGKSTTIKLLLNFLQPTSGSATILGNDIINDSVAIKSRLGYLSGEVALYPKLTGKEFLDYMADLQPLKDSQYLHELIRRFKADIQKPIASLSKGNRQKLGVIQAFMHQPEVLILDEPTSGLDPLMQQEFYKLVSESKAAGSAVFLSSHDLAEVQKMCDRVGFIRDGRLIKEQTIAELNQAASQIFEIIFDGNVPTLELKRIRTGKVVKHDGQSVVIHMTGSLAPLFTVLAKHKVKTLDRHDVDLSSEFLEFYKAGGK